MDRVSCVICSKPASDGYLTDTKCADRLRHALDGIKTLWRLIDTDDARGPGVIGHDGGRCGPGFGSRSPANDTVLSLTDYRSRWSLDSPGDIIPPMEVIGGWANDLRIELSQEPLTPSMDADITLLVRHLSHVTRQPWVEQMAAEVYAVHNQLKSVTGQPRPRSIGNCPNLVQGRGGGYSECGTRLYAPEAGDTLKCRSCLREWHRKEWITMIPHGARRAG